MTAAQAEEAKASPAPIKKATKWTCPMHPHYIADEFGTCPICGMDLVKLETGGQELGAETAETRTIITVAPEVMQNMGVRLGKAERSRFGRSVRSFGIVHENERLQTEMTARVEGWVEKLHVTAVGDEVKAGDKLFELFSPRLIVSQNDLLTNGVRESSQRGMTQLRSFGVQPRAIDIIKRQKKPLQVIPFFAERDGVVAKLALKQGSYTKRGMMLVMIQNYSSVWLKVSVAEKDLGFISKATKAKVAFPNLSGRTVTGNVDYIYPTIDTQTRTGQVRLVIDNPDGKIRPGSYADVVFEVSAEDRLAIPSEAVLQNGEGKFVVVSLGEGRFEPRLIETGLVSGRWTEATKGVKAGESIVVSGQFMLDSESALRESFTKLKRLQLPLSLLKLTKNQFAMVDHFVDAAIYLHETLIDGYDPEPKFLDPAISVRDMMWPRFKNTKLAFVIDDATKALREAQAAKSETEVQSALARLTTALKVWMMEGAPKHYQARKVALHKDLKSERVWFQLRGKPLNPYSRGKSEPIALPASKSVAVAPKKTTAPAKKSAPKGSHNGQ
ncbi:MAG: efflux RND transporter periplasmic adaptor subunit [Hyphomicrobiaceae bacterium]